jgi:hypothetical protein
MVLGRELSASGVKVIKESRGITNLKQELGLLHEQLPSAEAKLVAIPARDAGPSARHEEVLEGMMDRWVDTEMERDDGARARSAETRSAVPSRHGQRKRADDGHQGRSGVGTRKRMWDVVAIPYRQPVSKESWNWTNTSDSQLFPV